MSEELHNFTSLHCVLPNCERACDSQEFLFGGLDGEEKLWSFSVRKADGAKKEKKD